MLAVFGRLNPDDCKNPTQLTRDLCRPNAFTVFPGDYLPLSVVARNTNTVGNQAVVIHRATSDTRLFRPLRCVWPDACMVLAGRTIPACHATALRVVIGALLAPECGMQAVAVETLESGVNLSVSNSHGVTPEETVSHC